MIGSRSPRSPRSQRSPRSSRSSRVWWTALALGVVSAACNPLVEPASPWLSPRVVNDDGRGVVQFDPAVATGPDGALHAVWVDFRDGAGAFGIYHARREPGADRWTANTRVAEVIGPVCRDDPDVAVDAAGTVHVVWSDYRFVHPDIFLSSLPLGADAWSVPRRLNDDDTETIQWVPAIAADAAGGLHVAWSDHRDGDSDIYAIHRDAAGLWSPSARVHADPAGTQQRPAIDATPDGDIVVAWSDDRRGDPDIRAAVRAAGSTTWAPDVRVDDDPGSDRQAEPALRADDRGRVTLAWHDARRGGTIRAARWSATTGWGAPTLVSESLTDGAEPTSFAAASRPAVAAGAGGESWVTWQAVRDGQGAIHAARWRAAPPPDEPVEPPRPVDPSAGAWSSPTRLDGGATAADGRHPAAALDDAGRAHALWYGVDRDGQREIFHAVQAIPDGGAPTTPYEARGRLEYRGAREGCPAPGFVLVDCDGVVGPSLGFAIDPALLGRHVLVRGDQWGVGGAIDACPRIEDPAVTEDVRSPCPDAPAAVTGEVRLPPGMSPLEARVTIEGPSPDVAGMNAAGVNFARMDVARTVGARSVVDGREKAGAGAVASSVHASSAYASSAHVSSAAAPSAVASRAHASSAYASSAHISSAAAPSAVASRAGTAMANASTASETIAVGPDGRFYAAGLAPGVHRVRVALRCALTAATTLTLRAGALTRAGVVEPALGDLDGDCAVALPDLAAAAAAFGATERIDPPCADVDGNGLVDLVDLVIIAGNLDARCPAGWLAGEARPEGRTASNDAARRQPSPILRLDAVVARFETASATARDGAIEERTAGPAGNPQIERRIDPGVQPTDPTESDAPPSSASPSPHRIAMRLRGRDLDAVRGIALTLRFDPRGFIAEDSDPSLPGVQWADPASLPAGARVLRNVADQEAGRAHLVWLMPERAVDSAQSRAPIDATSVDLARMSFLGTGRIGHRPRITSLTVLDDRAAPVDTRVAVTGMVAASAYHLWLPKVVR